MSKATILVVAKHMIEVAAPDCVGLIEEGHGYIIAGDFGYIGSTVTFNEAWDIASSDAAQANAIVVVED